MAEAPDSITIVDQSDSREIEHAAKLINGKYYPCVIPAGPDGDLTGEAEGTISLTALNDETDVDVSGYGRIVFQTSGTYSLVLTCSYSINGTNYFTTNIYVENSNSYTGATINSSNIYSLNCVGWKYVKFKCTTYVSGTMTINYRCSTNTKTQAMYAVQSGAWYNRIYDAAAGIITGETLGSKRVLHVANVDPGSNTAVSNLTASSVNSSTSTLNNGATYTGTYEDLTGYNTITVACKTDQSGILYVDFSPDGTNTDSTLTYTVAAATNEFHRLTVTRRYFRVRFTNNSGSNQTYFRLQSLKGNQPLLTSTLNSTVSSDSDTILTRSILYGQQDSGNYEAVPVDEHGHLEVAIHSPKLPFGSIHTENLLPVLQHDAVYGLDGIKHLITTNGTGSVSSSNSMIVCSTGTTIYSAGSFQSQERLRYRPGQGLVGRWTAIYDSRVESSYSLAGFGHPEDGVYFGYVPNSVHGSTEFGILYTKGGVREVQTLTVSTGSSHAENITITLNSVAYSVPVTASGSIIKTAYEIATFSSGYTGWKAEQVGATVVFVADAVGDKAGTFTLSGASSAVGAFAETKAGVALTETFIPQSTWNGDKLDGTGPSGVTLDPQKLNVYEIGLQYLGAGPIQFKIEVNLGNNNSEFVEVHKIQYPNTYTTPSFGNPSFPFTMSAYSYGSTTDFSIKSASYAGFIEGQKRLNGNRFSYYGQKASVDAAAYYALVTVRNTRYYKGRANQSVVNLLSIAGALKHNNPCTIYVFRNAALAGTPNFSQYSADSVTYVDTAATTCTITDNNQIIWSGSLGDTGNFDFAWIEDEVRLQPGESVTVAAKSAFGTASYVIASLNTREDQ